MIRFAIVSVALGLLSQGCSSPVPQSMLPSEVGDAGAETLEPDLLPPPDTLASDGSFDTAKAAPDLVRPPDLETPPEITADVADTAPPLPERCHDHVYSPRIPEGGPVDCAGIYSDPYLELCRSGVDHCAGIARNSRGCEAFCAAAGLACVVAYSTHPGSCEPGAIKPCDEVQSEDYCWCAPHHDPFEERPDFCRSGLEVVFDPYHYRVMTPFPSNLYTRTDPQSPTCLRPHFPQDRVPEHEANFNFLPATRRQLEELDGFGASAKIAFELNTKLDLAYMTALGPSHTVAREAPVLLINVDETSTEYGERQPVLVTYYPDLHAERSLVLLHPTVPLRPGTKYAAFITNRLPTRSGECLGPSPMMARLLTGTAYGPGFKRIQADIEPIFQMMALRGLDLRREHVAGMTIFTTMDVRRDMLHVARRVLEMTAADPPVIIPGSLTWEPSHREQIAWNIYGRFESITYRDWATGRFQRGEDGQYQPLGRHEIKFRLKLPRTPGPSEGGEPYKIFAYHHGLAGSLEEGSGVGQRLAGEQGGTPRGWATGYISSIHHGERCTLNATCVPPDCTPCGDGTIGSGLGVMHFFGIEADQDFLDVAKIRDNFRQDYVDWLVFLQLLTNPEGLDVLPANEPNGIPDILDDKVGYTSLSLGGVMGGGIVALSPDIDIAFNNVGGGGVLDIILKGAMFGSVVNGISQTIAAIDKSAPSYELDRWFPFLQTIMDPGDPVNFALGMFKEPFTELGNVPKSVLFMMVVGDTIVGPLCNESLGRAAGTVQVGDPYSSVPAMPFGGYFPIKGNMPDGITTGYNQFHHNCHEGDTRQYHRIPFNHGDMVNKPVSVRQWRHFFESYYETGTAEIIDPYAPPLDCRYHPLM